MIIVILDFDFLDFMRGRVVEEDVLVIELVVLEIGVSHEDFF